MGEWKENKLSEFIILGNGKERPRTEGFIPVFGGNGILGYCDNSNYDGETIIIGRVGAYCGSVYYQNVPVWISDNALAAKPKKGNSAKFFYYYLKKLDLNSYAEGSSHPLITQTLLNSIDISIPSDIKTQTAIAEVLSSLDDKIDLLNRQNKTLEQIAETLFRQWFVESSSSGEYVRLGEFVETINGVSYKSSDLNPSKIAMVSLKSFDRNGGFRTDGFKEYTGKFKENQIVNEGDLIVAHTDITQEAEVIGNPALVLGHPNYDKMVYSMDVVKVVPKKHDMSVVFFYYLMKTREFKGHCEGNANGSTVLHLSKNAIPTFEFLKPDVKRVKEFSEHATQIRNKIHLNIHQIRALSDFRDTLLPKLMSGEVRVER
ncbi:MAG: restriction endonuclease subunit S [Ignavibacteriaceae bacterium]|nr:restriction endonuclease subunit S [Ignavibacteriaceae bacterium]